MDILWNGTNPYGRWTPLKNICKTPSGSNNAVSIQLARKVTSWESEYEADTKIDHVNHWCFTPSVAQGWLDRYEYHFESSSMALEE